MVVIDRFHCFKKCCTYPFSGIRCRHIHHILSGIQLCIIGNMSHLYSYKSFLIQHQLIKYLTFNFAHGQIDYIIWLAHDFLLYLNSSITQTFLSITKENIMLVSDKKWPKVNNYQLTDLIWSHTAKYVFLSAPPGTNDFACSMLATQISSFVLLFSVVIFALGLLVVCLFALSFPTIPSPIRISQCCWAAPWLQTSPQRQRVTLVHLYDR